MSNLITDTDDSETTIYATVHSRAFHRSDTCHKLGEDYAQVPLVSHPFWHPCERCATGMELPDTPDTTDADAIYISQASTRYHATNDCNASGDARRASAAVAPVYDPCKYCYDLDESESPHCPTCESPQITSLQWGLQRPAGQPCYWRCRDCNAEFQEPMSKSTCVAPRGDTLASKLHNADPDDLVPPSEVADD